MKIVWVDNFARESVADALIVSWVSKYWGERIVEDLNKNSSDNTEDYFKLVEDDYVLWRGMDELV